MLSLANLLAGLCDYYLSAKPTTVSSSKNLLIKRMCILYYFTNLVGTVLLFDLANSFYDCFCVAPMFLYVC